MLALSIHIRLTYGSERNIMFTYHREQVRSGVTPLPLPPTNDLEQVGNSQRYVVTRHPSYTNLLDTYKFVE